MKDLGIDIPISGEKSPIAPYGSVFWFRPKALEPLFAHGWQHSDFPPEPLPQDGTISHAIERIYPFVAQSAGYYPAVVMSKNYAVTHNDTMQAYASGMIRPLAPGVRLHDLLRCGKLGHRLCLQKAPPVQPLWAVLRQQAPPRAELAAGTTCPQVPTRSLSTPSVPSLDRTKAPTRTDPL